jgi:hypothetical protein
MAQSLDVSLPQATGVAAAARPALAIYYEHPRWFDRLFAELDRRGLPHFRRRVTDYVFDPGVRGDVADVVFNRMSPSAYHRGEGTSITHTLAWLGHLETHGVRVINGAAAFRHEVSKALQLSVQAAIGLPGPKARVIHRPEDAPAAAVGLRLPILVKPNVGGSGVGVVRFDSIDELRGAVASGRLDLGFDGVGLVQEFIPARGGHIVRVECVGGRYLYAIKVHLSGETFDLCPADICQTGEGRTLDNGCVVEAPKAGLKVDAFEPPEPVRLAVEQILGRMSIDVGGVEYVVDDRDGRLYYYDVNALSNFVADAPNVIGFEPHERLVDYLVDQVAEVRRGR